MKAKKILALLLSLCLVVGLLPMTALADEAATPIVPNSLTIAVGIDGTAKVNETADSGNSIVLYKATTSAVTTNLKKMLDAFAAATLAEAYDTKTEIEALKQDSPESTAMLTSTLGTLADTDTLVAIEYSSAGAPRKYGVLDLSDYAFSVKFAGALEKDSADVTKTKLTVTQTTVISATDEIYALYLDDADVPTAMPTFTQLGSVNKADLTLLGSATGLTGSANGTLSFVPTATGKTLMLYAYSNTGLKQMKGFALATGKTAADGNAKITGYTIGDPNAATADKKTNAAVLDAAPGAVGSAVAISVEAFANTSTVSLGAIPVSLTLGSQNATVKYVVAGSGTEPASADGYTNTATPENGVVSWKSFDFYYDNEGTKTLGTLFLQITDGTTVGYYKIAPTKAAGDKALTSVTYTVEDQTVTPAYTANGFAGPSTDIALPNVGTAVELSLPSGATTANITVTRNSTAVLSGYAIGAEITSSTQWITPPAITNTNDYALTELSFSAGDALLLKMTLSDQVSYYKLPISVIAGGEKTSDVTAIKAGDVGAGGVLTATKTDIKQANTSALDPKRVVITLTADNPTKLTDVDLQLTLSEGITTASIVKAVLLTDSDEDGFEALTTDTYKAQIPTAWGGKGDVETALKDKVITATNSDNVYSFDSSTVLKDLSGGTKRVLVQVAPENSTPTYYLIQVGKTENANAEIASVALETSGETAAVTTDGTGDDAGVKIFTIPVAEDATGLNSKKIEITLGDGTVNPTIYSAADLATVKTAGTQVTDLKTGDVNVGTGIYLRVVSENGETTNLYKVVTAAGTATLANGANANKTTLFAQNWTIASGSEPAYTVTLTGTYKFAATAGADAFDFGTTLPAGLTKTVTINDAKTVATIKLSGTVTAEPGASTPMTLTVKKAAFGTGTNEAPAADLVAVTTGYATAVIGGTLTAATADDDKALTLLSGTTAAGTVKLTIKGLDNNTVKVKAATYKSSEAALKLAVDTTAFDGTYAGTIGYVDNTVATGGATYVDLALNGNVGAVLTKSPAALTVTVASESLTKGSDTAIVGDVVATGLFLKVVDGTISYSPEKIYFIAGAGEQTKDVTITAPTGIKFKDTAGTNTNWTVATPSVGSGTLAVDAVALSDSNSKAKVTLKLTPTASAAAAENALGLVATYLDPATTAISVTPSIAVGAATLADAKIGFVNGFASKDTLTMKLDKLTLVDQPTPASFTLKVGGKTVSGLSVTGVKLADPATDSEGKQVVLVEVSATDAAAVTAADVVSISIAADQFKEGDYIVPDTIEVKNGTEANTKISVGALQAEGNTLTLYKDATTTGKIVINSVGLTLDATKALNTSEDATAIAKVYELRDSATKAAYANGTVKIASVTATTGKITLTLGGAPTEVKDPTTLYVAIKDASIFDADTNKVAALAENATIDVTKETVSLTVGAGTGATVNFITDNTDADGLVVSSGGTFKVEITGANKDGAKTDGGTKSVVFATDNNHDTSLTKTVTFSAGDAKDANAIDLSASVATVRTTGKIKVASIDTSITSGITYLVNGKPVDASKVTADGIDIVVKPGAPAEIKPADSTVTAASFKVDEDGHSSPTALNRVTMALYDAKGNKVTVEDGSVTVTVVAGASSASTAPDNWTLGGTKSADASGSNFVFSDLTVANNSADANQIASQNLYFSAIIDGKTIHGTLPVVIPADPSAATVALAAATVKADEAVVLNFTGVKNGVGAIPSEITVTVVSPVDADNTVSIPSADQEKYGDVTKAAVLQKKVTLDTTGAGQLSIADVFTDVTTATARANLYIYIDEVNSAKITGHHNQTVTIAAGAAAELKITKQPVGLLDSSASNANKHEKLSGQPEVTLVDKYGNVVATESTYAVVASVTTGTGTWTLAQGATATPTAGVPVKQMASGVANFGAANANNILVLNPGTETITTAKLTFTLYTTSDHDALVSTVQPVTSDAFTIIATGETNDDLVQWGFKSNKYQYPADESVVLTITLNRGVDGETPLTGTKKATLSWSTKDGTNVATDNTAVGVADFDKGTITFNITKDAPTDGSPDAHNLKDAATYGTLTLAIEGVKNVNLNSANGSDLIIKAGKPVLTMSANPSKSVESGDPLGSPAVTVADKFNNAVSYTGKVKVTLVDGNTAEAAAINAELAELTGTLTASISSKTATFSNLFITNNGAPIDEAYLKFELDTPIEGVTVDPVFSQKFSIGKTSQYLGVTVGFETQNGAITAINLSDAAYASGEKLNSATASDKIAVGVRFGTEEPQTVQVQFTDGAGTIPATSLTMPEAPGDYLITVSIIGIDSEYVYYGVNNTDAEHTYTIAKTVTSISAALAESGKTFPAASLADEAALKAALVVTATYDNDPESTGALKAEDYTITASVKDGDAIEIAEMLKTPGTYELTVSYAGKETGVKDATVEIEITKAAAEPVNVKNAAYYSEEGTDAAAAITEVDNSVAGKLTVTSTKDVIVVTKDAEGKYARIDAGADGKTWTFAEDAEVYVYLKGDANHDGDLDALDISTVVKNALAELAEGDEALALCDLNGDGDVDALDISNTVKLAIA